MLSFSFLYSQGTFTHSVADLEKKWELLLEKLEKIIGKKPADLNAVLFLIGVQELGEGVKNFSKEQKQDLMHIATCKLLSQVGYYELVGLDIEGWPHWEKSKPIPKLNLGEQEILLKENAILYFKPILDENNHL